MVIRKGQAVHPLGKGEVTESCGWLFVDIVPLLYERRRVARQLQVETWLDLAQLVNELKIEDLDVGKRNMHPVASYVV